MMEIEKLERHARRIRLAALERTVAKGKGHLGGTYSCVDILVALYYGGILRVDPNRPALPDRDRFILSKGHACLALYAILLDLGFLSKELYDRYGENGGLGVQIDVSIPGVDWNTGSLGHAVGVCCGFALAAKLDGRDSLAITIIGDAELAEGSVWEALPFAADHGLNNVVVIIDRNRLSVTEVMDDDNMYAGLGSIMGAFGWNFVEIDGHDVAALIDTLRAARQSQRPTLVLANTIKGKGVSFMENELKWHHTVPTMRELEQARRELNVVEP